jgi:uncharacterized protein related to proFAR isomerase
LKPHIHAKNSVKKYGGKVDDYQPIHDTIDSSKSAHATMKHRIVLHSAFGIYLVERIHGILIVNSDGAKVSVRDVAEDHVLEDLGTIPSLDKWLEELPLKKWMGGPIGKRTFVKID